MKIVIEVEDFYLENDEDLEAGLKTFIIGRTIQAINESIKARVEKQIVMEVKEQVEKTLYRVISSAIEEGVKTAKIKARNNSEMLTVENYIKQELEYQGGWNGIPEQIKKIAQGHAAEFKARYDMTFAAHVVQKLAENGLLKDDAVKMLIAGKE